MKTIYHNGIVITGSRQQDMPTLPTCLVVENDLVVHVGNTDDSFIAKTIEDTET